MNPRLRQVAAIATITVAVVYYFASAPNPVERNDRAVLTVFLMAPVLLGALLAEAFRRKLHRRAGLPSLLWGNALVLAFLTALVVASGEVHFRFFRDTTDACSATRLARRWMERHWHTNQIGARDNEEYVARIAAGKRRITFIGDSFTVGHGVADVDNRFSNLYRKSHTDREVHVMGQCGFDSDSYVGAVDELATYQYEFDLFVVCVTLNDIQDLIPQMQALPTRVLGERPNFFVRHSFFLDRFYYHWTVVNDPYGGNYVNHLLEHYQGETWNRLKERLTTIRDGVRKKGGKVAATTWPYVSMLGGDYPFAPVHRRFEQAWQELDVPYCESLPAFLPYSARELVVNSFDGHPNEKAHRIFQELLAPFLDEQLKRAEDVSDGLPGR